MLVLQGHLLFWAPATDCTSNASLHVNDMQQASVQGHPIDLQGKYADCSSVFSRADAWMCTQP